VLDAGRVDAGFVELGGDVPCVEVSSKTGQGLAELVETISALAEVRESTPGLSTLVKATTTPTSGAVLRREMTS
jgi:translation initiation factor IF-2